MILTLILLPLFSGLISFLIKSHKLRRYLLVITAICHLLLTFAIWWRIQPYNDEWFYFDYLGLFFLTITSLLFLASAIYGLSYLQREESGHGSSQEEGFLFKNIPEAVFSGSLLIFLFTMTLVAASQHFGVLWVAMEATTLASAPLISFHRNHRSLEATWKYLLICSVGIALALLGNLFLVAASSNKSIPFLITNWIAIGEKLNPQWLKAAFLFFFVGYGTKMGLAPLHTWLPDAHSEAPSMISALLSGALLNCAFLSLLRVYQVCSAAGLKQFAQEIFLVFGLFSILIATLFIIKQFDFKRLLAYSTIEHMGILAVSIGIGKGALFGCLWHILNHSLAKSSLFLLAGNIMYHYKSKLCKEVYGLNTNLPFSGALWIAGFFALTGTPPFSTFLSKFIILKAALQNGHLVASSIMLLLLALIFVGLAKIFLSLFQKREKIEISKFPKEPLTSIIGPLVFLALLIITGLYPPSFLTETLQKILLSLEAPQ